MSEDNTTQEPSVTEAPQQEAAHAAVDGCARVLAELVQGQATE